MIGESNRNRIQSDDKSLFLPFCGGTLATERSQGYFFVIENRKQKHEPFQESAREKKTKREMERGPKIGYWWGSVGMMGPSIMTGCLAPKPANEPAPKYQEVPARRRFLLYYFNFSWIGTNIIRNHCGIHIIRRRLRLHDLKKQRYKVLSLLTSS